jgi:hypothetical protein
MSKGWMMAVVALAGACGETKRSASAPIAMADAGAGGVDSSAAGGARQGGAGAGGAGAGGAGGSNAGGALGNAGSGQFGSGAGGGASFLRAAVEECTTACQTLAYRLPAALCEDWNRPGWAPEFCGLNAGPCPDYCERVYATVSPACAEVLPAALRCVAPTYATAVVNIPICWLEECRNQLYTMTSACYGLRERLAAARATWEASGVVDYDLEYTQNNAKVKVLVRAGRAPAVTPATATPWTVANLFAEVDHLLNTRTVTAGVTYDVQLGYVIDLAREQGCDVHVLLGPTSIRVAPVR